ncbi:MAG: hypothetical protein ACYC7L_01120 [Nitrospirota bacterium]
MNKRDDENINNLEKKESHLQQWLENYKSAGDVVPIVEKNLELTRWEIETLRNVPSAGSNEDLNKQIKYDAEQVENELPMMPKYSVLHMKIAYTSTASAATVYSGLLQNVTWGVVQQPDYAFRYLEKYNHMQMSHMREEEVSVLLMSLKIDYLNSLFARTKQLVYEAKSNPLKNAAAGNEMRNLMLKFKGELFAKSRINESEKNVTWEKMSSRLSGGDAYIEQELLLQEKAYGQLNDVLSDLLKERHQIVSGEVQSAWVQLLDHLFVTLGLTIKR